MGIRIIDDKIISYGEDGNLIQWNIEGDKENIVSAHQDKINGLVSINDNLLSYSDDGSIKMWTKDLELLKIYNNHTLSVKGIKILTNESFLSFSKDGKIIIWSLTNNIPTEILDAHSKEVYGVELLDDGKILSYSADKSIIIWHTGESKYFKYYISQEDFELFHVGENNLLYAINHNQLSISQLI
jgi:hypothetical protein